MSETARSLGVHDSILRRWKTELAQDGQKAFPGKGHTQDEELRELQRENQRLKETVEILKKGSGYLQQELPVRYQFIGGIVRNIQQSDYVRQWKYP